MRLHEANLENAGSDVDFIFLGRESEGGMLEPPGVWWRSGQFRLMRAGRLVSETVEGAMTAIVRTDAKPDAVIGGMRVTYLARSDATADAIGIYRVEMDPRTPGAGLHRHARLTETFAVEVGSLALHLDGTALDLGPGDFVLVRPGTPHAFANRGDQPVRFTLSFAPALAREGFFEGLADLAATGRLSDAAAMKDLMLRYDQEPLAGFDGWSALNG